MASSTDINALLEPHLFQVIGSTPASVRDSLKKVDLRDKKLEGAHLISVAIFASAVNKATLETFLSKPEFLAVRQIVGMALSIQNRTNMTAFTLLGHCIMTSKFASKITFVTEFRKKMGQDHLWAGNLESGSLSDKQKGILKEKRRVTEYEQAVALGSGFTKWVGLESEAFTSSEAEFWGVSMSNTRPRAVPRPASTFAPPASSSSSNIPRSPPSRTSASASSSDSVEITLKSGAIEKIPYDVYNYRVNLVGYAVSDLADSIERNGLTGFINNTRLMMSRDPDGSKTRTAASAV